ncbi:MAG: undecaprenyl/decaprenyl-phosphate alpha-N-acetylglucosaminyl 1-phosphate transferase [Verrucomicrobia bacterium]|jgi:UDP-GlcNAc:undecaprenyl-phosphate/decaprenyl-phosphate GlcNAc-1-phosphate transferase|nr:undecaprenyl/decaprenyl-phosphate alpha-N-acetylglucosaminyl 1-phosphate transferase [Verrucomicrobiota bacterium]
MTTSYAAALFGIAFISTIVATPIAKWLGLRLGLVDNPDNYRKIHQNAIPLGGGIAVFFGFVIPIALTAKFFPESQLLPTAAPEMIIMLIIGGSMSMLMGLADDIHNLKARWKIVFQIFAASLAYSGGFRIEAISSPFGNSIDLGFTSYLVTILWFLVCMNALNLVDGLDGLSAGIGFIVSITLLGVNFAAGNILGTLLNACISGALLGFLIFNFNPASIFLGDSGSMFIGFLIAAISLLTKNKAETATALLIPLMALGLPIFDMLLAIIRRWSRRNPISVADRSHIHHSLLSLGFSQRETVIVLYGISIVLCLASVIMVLTRSQYSVLILVLLALAMVIGTRVLKLINLKELRDRVLQDHEEHRWRKSLTIEVERAIQACAKANSIQEIWRSLSQAFESLSMNRVELRMQGTNLEQSLTWRSRQDSGNDKPKFEGDIWHLTLELLDGNTNLGSLIFIHQGQIRKIRHTSMFADRVRGALQARLIELATHRIDNPTSRS